MTDRVEFGLRTKGDDTPLELVAEIRLSRPVFDPETECSSPDCRKRPAGTPTLSLIALADDNGIEVSSKAPEFQASRTALTRFFCQPLCPDCWDEEEDTGTLTISEYLEV